MKIVRQTYMACYYMGGISQDVKTLKLCNFYPLFFFGFLDHLHFCCFDKITMCFKQLEARHIMSCDS